MYNSIVKLIIFLTFILFILPKEVAFASTISDSSAVLAKVDTLRDAVDDPRVIKTEIFLNRYNSPLTNHSKLLVEASDNYDLPWTLLVSIAGVESTFCKKMIRQSHNCWGWKNGSHNFESYEDAIFTVSKTLRYKYFSRGRTTPELIAPIYAPPSSTWSRKVRYFMNLLENTLIPDPSLQITL